MKTSEIFATIRIKISTTTLDHDYIVVKRKEKVKEWIKAHLEDMSSVCLSGIDNVEEVFVETKKGE